MKNDPKSYPLAEVDVACARFSKTVDLGIDFTNEIDVWTQMEFRARYQIKQLKQFGTLNRADALRDLNSYFYGIRQSLD